MSRRANVKRDRRAAQIKAAKAAAALNKRLIGKCPRGKIKHATPAAATAAIDNMRGTGAPDVDALGVYYCEGCAAWHVGHMRNRRRTVDT